jgi:hypothetical protein
MTAPRGPLALLTAFLVVTGVTLLVWAPGQTRAWGLLLGAAAGLAVVALLASLPSSDGPREITDESVAALIATGGVLLVLLGVAVGLWLILVGAGVIAGGLVALARERGAA